MSDCKQPCISVIIPVYNAAQYLSQCLRSVICQTMEDLEIICINDGSTDHSLEILSKYAKKDARIQIINQINQGAACSRNTAIQLSAGEYLFFLDADDWIPSCHTLQRMYFAAKKHQAYICGGSFSEYGKQGYIHSWTGNLQKYAFAKEGFLSFSEYQFDFGWVRFIYQRDFIISHKLELPPYRYFEDPVFFVKAMHEAKQFYCLTEPTYCYRIDYKPFQLSELQVIDLLHGLLDNILLAKKYHYNELLQLEKNRLVQEYSEQICRQLHGLKQTEIITLLENINCALYDGSPCSIEYDIMQSIIHRLDSIYQSAVWRTGTGILKFPKAIRDYFYKNFKNRH